MNYNSFIFGSSRVTGLYACYLQKKVNNSKFFLYANWNETIGGIYSKMKLVDSLGYHLDNVFIYMDTDFTFANEGKCNPNDHFLLTDEYRFIYYLDHCRSMLFPPLYGTKLKILFGIKMVGKEFPDWESDLLTNDCNHYCSDSILMTYGKLTFAKKYMHKIDSLKAKGFLYKRTKRDIFKENQISFWEEKTLIKIKRLFEKHNTKYYIIITPLYDYKKFSISDMHLIRQLFEKNVYDFSGVNKFTSNEYNYPDRSHFKPYISKAIADSIIPCYK
ncbi:MAG: hypothetical protein NTW16_08960 [Bacteroidetes bacterium]|nr:hypothetical protein [Bacteroidota bacterium]